MNGDSRRFREFDRERGRAYPDELEVGDLLDDESLAELERLTDDLFSEVSD